MIREVTVSARGHGEDEIYEPPSRVPKPYVIGDLAYLDTFEMLKEPERVGNELTASVQVPARSLLLALRAAMKDQA